MIGKSVPRVDAYEKVTGRAKFTEDLLPKRCLVAKVLHATIGNGIVKSIDTSEAESMEGVVKVVTFHDVPDHCYPTPGHPWSVELAHQDVADRNLLTGRVRYYGDDIMNITIKKGTASGDVSIPSSKSVAHRLLINAALTDGETVINGCLLYTSDAADD